MSHFSTKPAVGDRFFRVTPGRNSSTGPTTDWVEVTKVGRKWAEFVTVEGRWKQTGRFNIADGVADSGGYSHRAARVYRTEEEWAAAEEARKVWLTFRRAADRYTPPPGVTAADIRAAAALLKLDIKA